MGKVPHTSLHVGIARQDRLVSNKYSGVSPPTLARIAISVTIHALACCGVGNVRRLVAGRVWKGIVHIAPIMYILPVDLMHLQIETYSPGNRNSRTLIVGETAD